MRPLQLARSPEEPQFALALLKLVIELRHDRRLPMEQAIVRCLKGMRVDREAFRRWVVDHREHYERAAAGRNATLAPEPKPAERPAHQERSERLHAFVPRFQRSGR